MKLIEQVNREALVITKLHEALLDIINQMIIDSLDLLEQKTFSIQVNEEPDLDFNKFAASLSPEDKQHLRGAVDAARTNTIHKGSGTPVKKEKGTAPQDGEMVIILNNQGLPQTVAWSHEMAKNYNPNDFKPFEQHPRYKNAMIRLTRFAEEKLKNKEKQSQAQGTRIMQAIKTGELAAMKSYAPDATITTGAL